MGLPGYTLDIKSALSRTILKYRNAYIEK